MIAEITSKNHNVALENRRAAPLGKIAHIPATISKQEKKQASRVLNYKLLGYGQHLLIEANILAPQTGKQHRTRLCHTRIAYDQTHATIQLSTDDTQPQASIGNVQTCGSIWACPVCAERKMIEKAMEIKEAEKWAESEGLLPVMVTLTARHDVGMRLEKFKADFKASWDFFTNHRTWRKFKKAYQFKHKIANREVTRGSNGWHYHMHMLIFVPKDIVAQSDEMIALQDELRDHWMWSIETNGLEAIPERALVVTTGKNVVSTYLTKLGISEDAATGDLSWEMTGNAKKDSRSIWDILRHAYYGNEGDAALYLEYVQAMTGTKFITWSKGLHDLVDAYIDAQDDEDADPPGKLRNWLNIPKYWLDVLKVGAAYHTIVDIAARTRDIDAVRDCLYDIRGELLEAGKLTHRHKSYNPAPDMKLDISIHEDWLCHSISESL